MKSLSGSRRVTEILRRLGHTASYYTMKELETKLTFHATETGNGTPTRMSLDLEQATGIFDSFVETLTGKDSLHNTVGIAYQSSI